MSDTRRQFTRTGRGSAASPQRVRFTMRHARVALSVFVLALGASRLAYAQDISPRVEVRGFSGWAYGRTNDNTYLGGDPRGNYQRGSLAINLAAHPAPNLSIISQAFFKQTEEGTESELDYAFAEWRASDALRVRMGKIKQPFGIYTEVFDVGTLRPFLSLPQSVYGPLGFVAEGFEGVGVRGERPLGTRWNLSYDAYAGGIRVADEKHTLRYLTGEPIELAAEEGEETLTELLGSRLVVLTPVQGLKLGASAYTGREAMDSEHAEATAESVRHTVVGAHAEFLSNRVWVRSEYVHHTEGSTTTGGSYLETAYFLTRRWQASARVDKGAAHLGDRDVSAAPSLLKHRDVAVGANLWVTPEFVLKASIHSVEGNRLAGPRASELAATVAAGGLSRRTRLLQVGTQFSF